MKEIVAAQIGTIITNIASEIASAVNSGRTDIRFLSRAEMAFMSACDLGEKWTHLAQSRTLFCIDDSGELHEAEA